MPDFIPRIMFRIDLMYGRDVPRSMSEKENGLPCCGQSMASLIVSAM